MTSKERAKLKKQAMELESIFHIGKMGITPQTIDALRDALRAKELIKINILKNCDDETLALARILSERTGAEIVQVIGRRIVLYKKNLQKEKKKKLSEKRIIVKTGLKNKNKPLKPRKSRKQV